MVWFQCEDCGENLKKPKLPNHFRICSAFKLSCIDCGVTFGQETVQSHTQCITEAEKYGPKGQGKVVNGGTPKSNKDSKQKPNVDINVGLSDRPPWFCSLCNTKATSKQTLLLHADGKKHRAKARAFNAANQPPKQTEESTPASDVPIEKTTNGELFASKHLVEEKMQDTVKANSAKTDLELGNGDVPLKKKRKHDASGTEGTGEENKSDAANKASNGPRAEETEVQPKKAKHKAVKDDKAVENGSIGNEDKENIKWKKLIKSALKSNADGVLKMKKLKKLVVQSLRDAGVTEDETQLFNKLEQKINSSSRFRVDGRHVHLVAKD